MQCSIFQPIRLGLDLPASVLARRLVRSGRHSPNDSYGIIRGHSALMPAALMIGHHFSISTFCNVASACGVC